MPLPPPPMPAAPDPVDALARPAPAGAAPAAGGLAARDWLVLRVGGRAVSARAAGDHDELPPGSTASERAAARAEVLEGARVLFAFDTGLAPDEVGAGVETQYPPELGAPPATAAAGPAREAAAAFTPGNVPDAPPEGGWYGGRYRPVAPFTPLGDRIPAAARTRADRAIRLLLAGRESDRAYDACFEMGDGTQVVTAFVERVAAEPHLLDRMNPRFFNLGEWETTAAAERERVRAAAAAQPSLFGAADDPVAFLGPTMPVELVMSAVPLYSPIPPALTSTPSAREAFEDRCATLARHLETGGTVTVIPRGTDAVLGPTPYALPADSTPSAWQVARHLAIREGLFGARLLGPLAAPEFASANAAAEPTRARPTRVVAQPGAGTASPPAPPLTARTAARGGPCHGEF